MRNKSKILLSQINTFFWPSQITSELVGDVVLKTVILFDQSFCNVFKSLDFLIAYILLWKRFWLVLMVGVWWLVVGVWVCMWVGWTTIYMKSAPGPVKKLHEKIAKILANDKAVIWVKNCNPKMSCNIRKSCRDFLYFSMLQFVRVLYMKDFSVFFTCQI